MKDIFKTIMLNNRVFVLKENRNGNQPFSGNTENKNRQALSRLPNFNNTGMCLCGVLSENQTLDDFVSRYYAKKAKKTRKQKQPETWNS